MSPRDVGEIDAPTIAAIPSASYSGSAFRQVAPSYDPRSGEGARIHGGRFNPPDSFPVLYLCCSRACAVAEFLRFGGRQVIGPEGLLPRRLYVFEVELTRVLDLTELAVREGLALDEATLVRDDYSVTREMGVIAHGLGLQAIRSPSATGVSEGLAVLPEHLGAGMLEPELAETWETLEQVRADEE